MPDMLSVPPAPQAPPGPQDSAPAAHGREPEGPPFKRVLDDHQARTADAEGRSGGDDKPKGTDCDDQATTPDDKTVAGQPAANSTAQALALALTAAAPATATAETVAAATATAATAATAAATAATTTAAATATDAVKAPAAPGADVPATVPADATATDAPAVVATPGQPTGEHAGRQDAQGKPQSAPADAVAQALTDAKPVTTQPAAAQAATQSPAPTATPAEQAAEKAPEAPVVAQTPANPATANPAAGAPVTRQAPAPPVAAPTPLNTAHAVERIQAMVHLAHAHGNAHARLELHPAELGGVTIQLQVRHDGLHAHIAADRPEALPLLERAAGDLQRSLENRGIDLRGLDFGLAPDAEAGASHDDGRAQRRPGSTGADVAKDGDADADDEIPTVTTATRAVELPAGALVDVHA